MLPGSERYCLAERLTTSTLPDRLTLCRTESGKLRQPGADRVHAHAGGPRCGTQDGPMKIPSGVATGHCKCRQGRRHYPQPRWRRPPCRRKGASPEGTPPLPQTKHHSYPRFQWASLWVSRGQVGQVPDSQEKSSSDQEQAGHAPHPASPTVTRFRQRQTTTGLTRAAYPDTYRNHS